MGEAALTGRRAYLPSDLPQNSQRRQREERSGIDRVNFVANREQVDLFHEFLKPMLGPKIGR